MLFKTLSLIFLISILTSHCRSIKSTSELSHTNPIEISPAFAKGTYQDFAWQLRLNRGQCSHPPHPKTYCTTAVDKARIAQESGIEATLLSWINDPETEWVQFSYMTFGNPAIADALCQRAKNENFRVEILLKMDMLFPPEKASGPYKRLVECANGRNFQLYPRGDSWLNHAKIFMAGGPQRVHFTSSSANLSGSGTSLHYDNWLMLETPPTHKLAAANRCYLDAVKAAGESLHDNLTRLGQQRAELMAEKSSLESLTGEQPPAIKTRIKAIDKQLEIQQDKGKILKAQELCLAKFPFAESEAIVFLGTPLPPKQQQVVDRLGTLIDHAKNSISIAAHKITKLEGQSLPIVDKLLARIRAGVKVSIVFDDDTILRYKNIGGITGQQVSPQEVDAYLALEAGGANIKFLDTNEADFALMHNKFMIFDNATIFTGAGNFSRASLRGTNTEQFYIIAVPEIVEAYQKGWNELYTWALPASAFTAESQAGSIPEKPAEEAEPVE